MKAAFLIAGALLLMLMASSALAEQAQERTIKTFLNPFYVGSWIGGTNPVAYNYSIDINPPDGLMSVKSAIISWDVWVSPSVNFTLKVNGRPCNTPFYYISTTYASSGLARINFDCSDEIKSKGHYIVSMTASKDCGSSTGWLELTYMNNPLYMTTGGTEYQFGQNATAFVRLVDGSNRPINLGSCNAAVFYPNKTLWIQNNNMTFLNSGYYYSDLGTVPSIEGVYIVSFDCIIPAQIFSQTEAVSSVLASGDTYSNFFGFDNDENFSINAVNMTVRASRGGAATTINVTLNGNIVQVISLTGTPTSYNFPVGIGNISVAEDQLYSIINNGISSVTLESVSLFVNYTSIQPQQIIRGQTELHVSGWISGLNNTLYPFIADTWNNTKEAHMGYVSGSIYAPNDTGEAEILFLDRTGAPVTNANCTITIEYPNETVWISSANMSRELETDGFFEYQFKVPDTVGIYTTSIACTSPSVTGYVGGDFQVQNPASIKYVGGTEYSAGQDGRLVVQLLSAAGAPINTGTCTGNLSYPNNTRFATNFALSYQTASNGIYAFNFTVPSTEGIYVSDVKCTGGPLTLFTSGTFHVSPVINVSADLLPVLNYLNQINATAHYINDTEYPAIIAAISSVNSTQNINHAEVMVAINQLGLNLTSYYGSLVSLLDAHNISMTELINALNQSQNSNYAALENLVNAHNLSMTQLMLSINQSNGMYFNDIESQITSLQNYMIAHNQTIYDLLIAMNGSCFNNTQRILNYIDAHNMSIVEILDSLNSTMYNSFSLIASELLNLSNSTINISLNVEDLYRRIRNIVYVQTEPTRLTSQTSMVTAGLSFAPTVAAQSLFITNATCLTNATLRQFYDESIMLSDSVGTDFLNTTRHIDSVCDFGCDNSTIPPSCKASPIANAAYFFVFIFIMIAGAGVLYARRK